MYENAHLDQSWKVININGNIFLNVLKEESSWQESLSIFKLEWKKKLALLELDS